MSVVLLLPSPTVGISKHPLIAFSMTSFNISEIHPPHLPPPFSFVPSSLPASHDFSSFYFCYWMFKVIKFPPMFLWFMLCGRKKNKTKHVIKWMFPESSGLAAQECANSSTAAGCGESSEGWQYVKIRKNPGREREISTERIDTREVWKEWAGHDARVSSTLRQDKKKQTMRIAKCCGKKMLI